MSKIEDLIKQYCPDGVEWKRLGEIANISTGLNPRKNFILNTCDADKYYVTVKEITSGEIKFADNTDKINLDAWGIIQKRSNVQQGSVLLSGIGTIGKVAVVTNSNFNWNCSESIYVINPNLLELNSYFLKYYLESSQIQYLMHRKSQGGTLKGIRQGDLKQFLIPIPHIAVQDEIVRILDKFTELEKELEKELELRRKQYEFYRDELLTFGDDVERERLGDVCSKITDGSHSSPRAVENGYYMPSVKDMTDNGFVLDKCKQISLEDYNALVRNGCKPEINDVVIAKDGSMLRYIFEITKNENIVLLSSIAILRPLVDVINPRYLVHCLRRKTFRNMVIEKYSTKGGVPRIILKNFKQLEIPVPSITEQERIVKILDKFDTLTTSLTSGLPAEIKLRKQQYEYYRDYLFGLLN